LAVVTPAKYTYHHEKIQEGDDTMSGYLHNFDLTIRNNILRLTSGAFFIPHIWAKFSVPEAPGFFVAVKFRPLAFWLHTA
jgi:hypothetical protein